MMALLASLSARPAARAVVLFSGLNLFMVLVFTLLTPSGLEGDRDTPLLSPWRAGLRVTLALLLYSLIVWSVRPGKRRVRELLLLGGAGALFTGLAAHYYFAFLPLAVVPIVARYWLNLKTTVLLTVASFFLTLPLWMWTISGEPRAVGVLVIFAVTCMLNGYTLLSFEFALREARAQEHVRALGDLAVRHAELGERTRIARELHDTLGHHLTAQRFDLQLLSMHVHEAAAVPVLQRATERNLEAIADVRRAVKASRPETLAGSLVVALRDLLEVWPSPVTLNVEGEEPALSFDVKLAVYRAAQEALTNARKHAPSQALVLSLSFTTRDVRLRACNPSASQVIRAGAGLLGLQERARTLGGVFRASVTAGVFDSQFLVPLEPVETP